MDALLFPVKLLLVLAFFVVAIAAGLLPIVALVSAIATPGDVWGSTGRSKLLWVVALLLLNIFAAVPYWFVIRPQLVDRA